MKTALLCLLLLLPGERPDKVYLRDNSDWWSRLSALADATPQSIETPATMFQILGVSLDEQGFSGIPAKFGSTVAVGRGDASEGRQQLCFASTDKRVHLVFEQGEVHYAYYIFYGGADWNGSQYCRKSTLVVDDSGNAAGIHLGMSPAEVRAILGKPTASHQGISNQSGMRYARLTRTKLDAEEKARIRERSPQVSEAELNAEYEVSVEIETRFTGSRLTYLAVVRSETN
jgi:hypothetical protein